MTMDLSLYEVWFVTGSQLLYGEETLKKVEEHSKTIARFLDDQPTLPVKTVFKQVLTSPEGIHRLVLEANSSTRCVGIITWMHTFSPAKMWIAGLAALQKPLAHLHTQFNREIPWSDIDMDFMNLNQSAHGGREYGFMVSRLGINRKVIVGFWQDPEILAGIEAWMRAASAWSDAQGVRIARIGDNMREVAVTEGNKVSAQIQFGYSVNGYGIADLEFFVGEVSESKIDNLLAVYESEYTVADSLKASGKRRTDLRDAARMELGMKAFLENGDFKGYTDTFENLGTLPQLPGLASQRLMAQGYGFGAEGDWKTSAFLRAMKVMGAGRPGGTSFMEDYTYHLDRKQMKVLGAHMLEVCPSIADGKPSLEIHPLSIGGKGDPVRLVFDTAPGPGLNATIVDLGNRFRMIVNEIEVTPTEHPLPKLPVARVLWTPKPDFTTAVTSWIYAGGAHHMVFSQSVTAEELEDFAEIAGIEFLLINDKTTVTELKKELRFNEVYYGLSNGFR
jgi:L-arabinose isomerase